MKDLQLDLKQRFSKSYMLSFIMYTWNSLDLPTLVNFFIDAMIVGDENIFSLSF